MNIRYPVRKADGREYKNYHALLARWYSHRGVSPASLLSQEAAEKSVPLQFMMDGEVVTWRVNSDYVNIEYRQAQPLRQSGTFVLVRSVYKPDERDASSWLTLYTRFTCIWCHCRNTRNVRFTG